MITKSYLFFVMFNPEIEIEDKLIHHLVSNKSADLKQSDNLTTLLSKGTVHLQQSWDKCYSLNVSFAECSFKPQKLASYSTTKQTISSVKKELKDMQSQNRMFRIQIAWCVQNNVVMSDLRKYVTNTLPRAIATIDGLPYKRDKSKVLNIYKTRYSEAFNTDIDFKLFDSLIIDAMFFIQFIPWRSFSIFHEYIKYLYIRNVLPYFEVGIQTVHIVFDEQGVNDISPRAVERSRRDLNHNEKPIATNLNIESLSLLPPEWDKYIKLRENKKSLINLVSIEFLSIVKNFYMKTNPLL